MKKWMIPLALGKIILTVVGFLIGLAIVMSMKSDGKSAKEAAYAAQEERRTVYASQVEQWQADFEARQNQPAPTPTFPDGVMGDAANQFFADYFGE